MSGSIVNRYQYFLNSAQATNRDPATPECEYYLNKQLTLKNVDNAFEVFVNKVNLPYTFYQWSNNNNTIAIWGSYDFGTPYSAVFLLEPGNYNIVSFITQINSQLLTTLSGVTGGWVTNAKLDYVYNPNTNKVKIRLVGDPSFGWTLNFYESEVVNALGFDTLSLSAGGLYQLPVRTVNVNPIMNVYITSQNFVDDSTFDALSGSVAPSSIIAIVPIVHSPLFYQPTDNPVPIRIRLTVDTISVFDFNIIDSKGRTLVMDQPWSIQFTIEELDVGYTNAIGNQYTGSVNTYDPLEDLKNQILKESVSDANLDVQKRTTNNQTGSRKRTLDTISSEKSSTITREQNGSGTKSKTIEKTLGTSSGSGNQKT